MAGSKKAGPGDPPALRVSNPAGGRLRIASPDGPRPVALEAAAVVLPPGGAQSSTAVLSARSEVVPFLDHRGQLRQLVKWCTSREPCSVRILTGAPGIGKTRLGVRLCQEVGRRGWLAGLLATTEDTDAVEALAEARTARLVFVDGANHHENVLVAAAQVAAQASPNHPVRIVFTVRSDTQAAGGRGAAWELRNRIDARLGSRLAEVEVIAELDPVARRKLYAGAFRTFADRPAGPVRRQPPPPRLTSPGTRNRSQW
ncbi:MAG TPA: hypothetical protein VHT49_00015 [Acidimicrobiales bacterium]|nr:hypothetical protein [Acidimicrobiales bacterium]